VIFIATFLEPKDESTNDDKRIFPLFSMKHEYDLLAGSSGISADCKPSSGHLKLESHSGEDKGILQEY